MSVPKGTTELKRVTDVIGLPWVGDREACAVAFQGQVACFDLGNGNQLWGRDMSSSSGLEVDARYVYVSEDRGAVSLGGRAAGACGARTGSRTGISPRRCRSARKSPWATCRASSICSRGTAAPSSAGSRPTARPCCSTGGAPERLPGADLGQDALRPRYALTAGASPASRSRSSRAHRRHCRSAGRRQVDPLQRLTRSRDALVADVPGLTRDRHYEDGQLGPRPYYVVDTGGLEPVAKDGLLGEMAKQTAAALAEADAIIFLADAREGVTPQDRRIAGELRKRAPASGSSRTRPRVWTRPSRPRSSTSSVWASRTPSAPRTARASRR